MDLGLDYAWPTELVKFYYKDAIALTVIKKISDRPLMSFKILIQIKSDRTDCN
ncbi:MAG: hypothetical protein V7K24_10650 [Nostoc sp.]